MTTAAALSPAAFYGRLLATAASAALDGSGPRARLRLADGRLHPLPLDRWLAPCTPSDAAVLDRARGPVLDVGCGPGRLLAALAARDVPALGVDLSPEAVLLARRRGGRAVAGSVFADVPGAGSWETGLLLDGNIGIGGDPTALLSRMAALLAPGGETIAEVAPAGEPSTRVRVRIEAQGEVSDWFPWATVSADDVGATAAAAGLRVTEVFRADGRTFARIA